MTNVIYEWVIEDIEENGDIVDANYAATLAALLRCRSVDLGALPESVDIGISRAVYDDYDAMIEQYYAYVDKSTGNLPQIFEENSCSLPCRFHKELDTLKSASEMFKDGMTLPQLAEELPRVTW